MTQFNIQFTRFSAFYSPLISTISGGFLAEEGFEPTHSVSPPGVSAIEALLDGSAHVEITRAAYEVTLDVFEHVGRLTKRHAYEDVCAQPPAE